MSDAQRLADAFGGAGLIGGLDHKPTTVEEGYALQDKVRTLIDRPVIGWKLAQTTPAVQKLAGIKAPTVAPLLQGMIVPEDTVFPAGRFYKPEGEAELAIELQRDIDGPATPAEVADAAAGFRQSIEIADTRYTDKKAMGVPAVIADMNSSAAVVVGPLEPLAGLAAVAASPIEIRLGDGTMVPPLPTEMRPDPLTVVSFLTHFLAERGEKLSAGMIITTGTHNAPTPTGPGLLVATYAGTGRLSARLSEAAV